MATIKKLNIGAIAAAPRIGILPTGGPAQLILNVTAFQATTTGKYCATDAPRIFGNPGDRIAITGSDSGRIVVKEKADFEITITSSTGTSYAPVGLAFVGLSGSIDPQGKDNFGTVRWELSTIKFTAHKRDVGVWKLFILVADTSGPKPVVGLIDLDIENQN